MSMCLMYLGIMNPAAMCLSPSGDKLYVMDDLAEIVFVYSTVTFRPIGEIQVGNKPVAILVEPDGKRGYVANYGESSVTIFDAITLKVIKDIDLKNYGMPFAIACNENNNILVACKGFPPTADFVVYFTIYENELYGGIISLDVKERVFVPTHNPLTVQPNGHTLVELANIGSLAFVAPGRSLSNTTNLLDNTVSGVYLDNGLLSPLGGLQIIDVDNLSSRFVELASIGDLAFFSDTKAYVGGFNHVTPFDLATARPLPPISIGTVYFRVKNVISGYSNQSS